MADRTRYSWEELRDLLLETGRTMLKEEGLSSGAEALTFKRVFERVERDTGTRLTNASVIRRVWDSQADYQSEVLVAVAKGQDGTEIELAMEALAPIVATITVTARESREQALKDLCRLGGALNAAGCSRVRELAIVSRRVGADRYRPTDRKPSEDRSRPARLLRAVHRTARVHLRGNG